MTRRIARLTVLPSIRVVLASEHLDHNPAVTASAILRLYAGADT